jgi:tetratricopeptide (TPR) repeat protein
LHADPEHRQRAKRISDRVMQTCASRTELYQQIFVVLDRSRNEPALRRFVDLIVAADVDDPTLVHKACAKLQAWDELGRALEYCERQLDRSPDHHHVLTRYARILLALGRTEDAVSPLRRLIDVSEDDQWGYLTLVRTLMKLKRSEEALDIVDRLLAHVSDQPLGLALKARLLWKAGRVEEAVAAARSALDARSDDPQVAQNASLVLRELAV